MVLFITFSSFSSLTDFAHHTSAVECDERRAADTLLGRKYFLKKIFAQLINTTRTTEILPLLAI